jgi:phosphate transport system permease protein
MFMNTLVVAALLLILLGVAYQTGWSKSRALATATGGVKVHSRPQYHAAFVALWAMIPALAILILWGLFGGTITRNYAISQMPADVVSGLSASELNPIISRVQNIASGYGVAGEVQPYEQAAGTALAQFNMLTFGAVVVLAAIAGGAGLYYARSQIASRLRARNAVERVVNILLIACSAVAILTTVGIVLSLITEAIRFFTFINPIDFFFGTVWAPNNSSTGGYGRYGLLPLLAGTLMITAIAMLVAVPVGLMAAIYLSQYAPRQFRAVVKPMIEILAGIPTIVFGFFALVTVGPFLRDLGGAVGLSINATSALTAGVVMGIMIIPFVSSLSDDILTQVPRSLRDGAYGLGATQSETIRNVLLPAALPGIVGAFLLAVSRAVGETMIVVLAAGNAPVLRGNPFEPVATITVSIVNQLTGDTDFSGPQSLVAFALGLTLFVLTLCLNVFALYIVRRFREQYE